MKKREGDAWMPADEYGRSLQGVGFNLLVADMAQAIAFHLNVLEVTVIYSDADFAAISGYGGTWMLHSDHTYQDHPLHGIVTGLEGRGAGVELRIYNCDPDRAVANARKHDYTVLADAMDKPHGQREAFIIDNDGYVWVPGIPI